MQWKERGTVASHAVEDVAITILMPKVGKSRSSLLESVI